MWNMVQSAPTVARMNIQYKRNKDWKFRILVTADRHLDSKYSRHQLQRKHLREAKENDWPIIDLGDVMDAMQGVKDPRGCRSALIPFLMNKDEYFDAVVNYAADFMAPYSDQFAMIGYGNHETSALRHNGTDLTRRLVKRLNERGRPTLVGCYAGWLKLQLKSSRVQQSLNVWYTHGSGGSAPVTKGAINTNRRAVSYPDAHIILSGHTHDAYNIPLARERLSESGKVYDDKQLHVQVMSYKNATTGVGQGFEKEKGFQPQPTGAYWLELEYDTISDRVVYDAKMAQ